MDRKRSLSTTLALGLIVALLASLPLRLSSVASMAQGPEPEANTERLAPVGTAFTYQGRLQKDGVPVDNTCDLQFSLWDALTEGNQVGATQTRTNAQVREGLFTVADLDFAVFNGQARWLQVGVQCSGETSFTVLSPRQALTAAPYASYAAQVGAHDHLGQTWTGSNNPLTIGGSFTGLSAAPLILSNASENGLVVTSAGQNGLAVGAAGTAGVYVDSAGYGLLLQNAQVHGIEVGSADYEGVRVDQAGRRGMYVVSAVTDGMVVDSAGEDGVEVGSAGQDGVHVQNAAVSGVAVINAVGDGLYVGSAGHDGVHVGSASRDGIHVETAEVSGVAVITAVGDGVYVGSAGNHGGAFTRNSFGVWANGSINEPYDTMGDLQLGGGMGEIRAEGSYFLLSSNGGVYVYLDWDASGSSCFYIFNDTHTEILWQQCEDGAAWSAGPQGTFVQTADHSTRGLYAMSSPEVWFEDVGRGRLVDGEAVIAIDPVFAGTVVLDDYYVYLTAMGDDPVLLHVPFKTRTQFTVRGVTIDGQPARCAFDYRIVARRLGYEGGRLPAAEEIGLEQGKVPEMEDAPSPVTP